MKRTIAFIGGIHGVGKSTTSKLICDKTGLNYLSASEIIKWAEFNNDSADKKVFNVAQNQNRLIIGLKTMVNARNKYLLDGHYCLVNKLGTVERIPLEIFTLINPYSLNLLIDDVSLIKDRLEKRDFKIYDIDLLHYMQETEISHANEIAKVLKIPLNIFTVRDIDRIVNLLR
ncbi:MAG: AAA family ATPase [Chitinophagales bacterium]|nr:AAA family ATPase [Chitinophagales bacterium]